VVFGKPEGKRALGRLWRRREVTIEMDPKDVVWEGRCELTSSGSVQGPVNGCSEK